jgi:hypothetical protein
MSVTKRSDKGSELTWAEMDANLDALIELIDRLAPVLNASGRILIGTATDDGVNKLQVNGTVMSGTHGINGPGTVGADRVVNFLKNSVPRWLIGQYSPNDETGSNAGSNFQFIARKDDGTMLGYPMTLMRATGNLLIGTTTENTTTGNAKLQTANGIYLGNSANSAANVLDWYEEGTFTPTAFGTTTAGTGTYSAQTGFYTRIGRVVFFQLQLAWSAHTGVGGLRVGGLPFVAATNAFAALSVYCNLLTVGAGKQCAAFVYAGNSFIAVYASDPAGGASTEINGGTFDTSVSSLTLAGHCIV